jgi:hypothetical protein
MAVINGLDGTITATVSGQPVVLHITGGSIDETQELRPYITYDSSSDWYEQLVGCCSASMQVSFMISGTTAAKLTAQAVSVLLGHNGTVTHSGTAYMSNISMNTARTGENGGTCSLTFSGAVTDAPA